MSRLGFQVDSGIVTWAATAKTVFTLTAPANQRVVFKGIGAYGQGTTNTDAPLQVEIMTYASISGGTAGSVTSSKKANEMTETIQSTIAGNYSAEPTYTTGVTVKTLTLHPQLGQTIFWPLGDEIIIKGGTGLAVRITSANADKAAFWIELEE